MPRDKTPGQVFWENVDRYRIQNGDTIREFCHKLDAAVNWYNDSRNRSNLPRQTFIRKVAIEYELQYVDLFEDWD